MTTTTAWRVYFVSDTGLVDTSTAGTVTDRMLEDPDDGYIHLDLVKVTWDDGEVDILSIDNICECDGRAR